MAVATKLAARAPPGPEVAFVRFADRARRLRAGARCGPMRARNKLGLFMRGAYGGAAVLFYFIGDRPPAGRDRDAAQLHGAGVHGDLRGRCSWARRSRRATLGALALTSVGVALVIAGTAPAGIARRSGRWQLVGRAVGDAVGRRGRDDPPGAQDRRIVGDLHRVLPGGRRDRARRRRWRGWVAADARRVGDRWPPSASRPWSASC